MYNSNGHWKVLHIYKSFKLPSDYFAFSHGGVCYNYLIQIIFTPQRTYAERVRGEARKKWLQQVIQAGETSGISMEPIYKAVFQALYKVQYDHGLAIKFT